ncbi:hypothetical protein ES708_07248 [subsurface metagenome]
MKESGKYLDLWRKYLPAIRILIKNSKHGLQKLSMSQHEFEAVGEREKAGYQFNLEFSNGKVINTISGSAVARDLRDIIYSDSTTNELISDGTYKINLDSSFILNIKKL